MNQRLSADLAVEQPIRDQPARVSPDQPIALDPSLFAFVSGGLPRGGWAEPEAVATPAL